MLADVLGGSGALVGVVEAELINVVLTFRDLGGACRGGQGEDTILVGLSGNGDTGGGGYGTDESLHAPVNQIVVSVDGLFSVVFVILRVEVDLDAALGIDLLDSQFSAILGSVAVNGCAAGQGANKANLQCAAVSAGATAADKEGCYHDQNQYKCYNLFHFSFSFQNMSELVIQ